MNREITLIHKAEPEKRRRLGDMLEQYSKILAAIALPAVVALGGWWVQRELAANSTRQEYVKIAVSILSAKNEPGKENLRTWATGLLNEYSPVKLTQDSQKALSSGDTILPSSIAQISPPLTETQAAPALAGAGGWCYLGRFDGHWHSSTIQSPPVELPQPGAILTVAMPTNLRSESGTDGPIVGTIRAGKKIRIGAISKPFDLVWAEVTVLP